MTVRPLFDRVLVKRNEEPTKTKSGLFLPETSKEKPSEGTVLAVGNGRVSDDGKELLLMPTPKAAQRSLNFLLDTTGANTDGANVTWSLTALKTSAGDNIAVGSNTIEKWPLENTRLTFDVDLPRDWPPGQYRVDVKIGSQLLSALQFEIAP